MLIEGVAGKLIILFAWVKMIPFWRMEVNGLVVSQLLPITVPLLEDSQIYFPYAIDSTMRSNCSSYYIWELRTDASVVLLYTICCQNLHCLIISKVNKIRTVYLYNNSEEISYTVFLYFPA